MQDGSCNDGEAPGVLKGEGAGPGDGTGDCDGEPIKLRTQAQDKKQDCVGPLGEPKQDQTRQQKQDQLQDGSCNDGEAPGVLKGEGAGPGDGTGEGEPIMERTQAREAKKTCLSPEPQELKVQARVSRQEKTKAGVEEDEDEFTPEFLMFLKSYFAEADARQQREGEAAQVQNRLRLVKKIQEAQKTMERTRKGE